MTPVLIAYSTTEGQAGKVASFMADVLASVGYRADVVDVASPQASLVQPVYTMALIGGSVHVGHHADALDRFVKMQQAWLRTVPVAFFSVSLTAARQDETGRAEAQRMMHDFLAQSSLEPARTYCIAGALRYSRYGLLKRFVMRRIARKEGGDTDLSHDFEYTDWDAVRRFVLEFARDSVLPPRQAA